MPYHNIAVTKPKQTLIFFPPAGIKLFYILPLKEFFATPLNPPGSTIYLWPPRHKGTKKHKGVLF
jgi:hypothetical protein